MATFKREFGLGKRILIRGSSELSSFSQKGFLGGSLAFSKDYRNSSPDRLFHRLPAWIMQHVLGPAEEDLQAAGPPVTMIRKLWPLLFHWKREVGQKAEFTKPAIKFEDRKGNGWRDFFNTEPYDGSLIHKKYVQLCALEDTRKKQVVPDTNEMPLGKLTQRQIEKALEKMEATLVQYRAMLWESIQGTDDEEIFRFFGCNLTLCQRRKIYQILKVYHEGPADNSHNQNTVWKEGRTMAGLVLCRIDDQTPEHTCCVLQVELFCEGNRMKKHLLPWYREEGVEGGGGTSSFTVQRHGGPANPMEPTSAVRLMPKAWIMLGSAKEATQALFSFTGEVYEDYRLPLSVINIENNPNEFYFMQILKINFLWTELGRLVFEKKFEKWRDRFNFEPYDGMYTFIQVKKQYVPCTLDDAREKLIKAIFMIPATDKTADHRLYQLYESLNCRVTLLDPDSEIFKIIKTYYEATGDNSCGQRIVSIFEIDRNTEAERFSNNSHLENRRLVWHGTDIAVVADILKTGLKIMPHSQGRAGRGIYFASESRKSAKYVKTNGNIGVMFLCEVALGREHTINSDDRSLTKPPPDCDSVVARGKVEPDPRKDISIKLDGKEVVVPQGRPIEQPEFSDSSFESTEYVIYNESQCRLRYLVKMHSTDN